MKHKLFLATALSASFAACLGISAHAKTIQSVGNDKENAVIATDGSCLHTKWDDKKDCAQTKKVATSISAPDLDQRTIYFDSGKSTLTKNSKQKLDTLVLWANTVDVESARIVGYADAMGNAKQNEKLSQARAKAVQQYLKKKGASFPVSTEVKGTETSGTTHCEDSLSKAEKVICLAADRRVEVEFTPK